MAQEGEEFLVSVPAFTLREHLTGGDMQGSEQRHGAMADTVVGHPFDATEPHRQRGSGALKRLDLGLFVRTPDHGMVRRIQIKSNDIAGFFDEAVVVGQLEGRFSVRLSRFARAYIILHYNTYNVL